MVWGPLPRCRSGGCIERETDFNWRSRIRTPSGVSERSSSNPMKVPRRGILTPKRCVIVFFKAQWSETLSLPAVYTLVTWRKRTNSSSSPPSATNSRTHDAPRVRSLMPHDEKAALDQIWQALQPKQSAPNASHNRKRFRISFPSPLRGGRAGATLHALRSGYNARKRRINLSVLQ